MAVLLRKLNAHFTERHKERILTLKDERYGPIAISAKTHLLRTTISSFLKRYANTLGISFKSKPGRSAKLKLSSKAEKALVRAAILNLIMPLKKLAFSSKSDKQLNYYSIAKVLKKQNKTKRGPAKSLR